MKIVVINGQNHKGSTWNIGNLLINKITSEKEVIEFFLPRDLNHFCTGCYSCLVSREKCPFWDEKEKIMSAILEADLLIFTTPNYCMMPSAQMKAFLDLFFTNWMAHKPYPEMFFKRAIVISTTAGAGAKNAINPIAKTLTNWGIPSIKKYGIAVNAMNWNQVPQKKKEKIEIAISKLAKNLSKDKKVRVGIKTRLLFKLYLGMQKANWGASKEEKQYWIDNGFFDGRKPWKI